MAGVSEGVLRLGGLPEELVAGGIAADGYVRCSFENDPDRSAVRSVEYVGEELLRLVGESHGESGSMWSRIVDAGSREGGGPRASLAHCESFWRS